MQAASPLPLGEGRINCVEFYRPRRSGRGKFLNLDKALLYRWFTLFLCGAFTLRREPDRTGEGRTRLHVALAAPGPMARIAVASPRYGETRMGHMPAKIETESQASQVDEAWRCIGCGRIEAQRPCIGVCEDRKVRLVFRPRSPAACYFPVPSNNVPVPANKFAVRRDKIRCYFHDCCMLYFV